MRRLFRFGGRSPSSDRELVDKVCVLVAQVFELPPDLRPTGAKTPLIGRGVGVDSLDALRLVAALEEEFDLTIDDLELTPSALQSVGSIVALIKRLRRDP